MSRASTTDCPFTLRSLSIGLLGLVGSMLSAADPLVYVSGNGPEIIGFSLDGNGRLTELSRTLGGKNPRFMAFSPDRKYLYAINEGGSGGTVISFAIDHASGALTKTGEGSIGDKSPACHVSVHPSGKWIFTASYVSGLVSVLPVKVDGSVGDAVDVQMAGKKAHQTVINKDGSYLFVPTLGTDEVQVYRIDAVLGKLILVKSIALAAKAGPRHCALSHDEKYLYVINEYSDSVTTFLNADSQFGVKDLGTVSTLPADVPGDKNTCAHIVVSPDGRTIYGSNRGHNSLAIFRVSDDGAKLTSAGHQTADGELNIPRNFSLTPDGAFALVASQKTNVVTVFAVDSATGGLTKVGAQPVGPEPTFVGVLPR